MKLDEAGQREAVRRLWQAVVVQAVQDALSDSVCIRNEARFFIRSGAFEAICELTDLNARRLRADLDRDDLSGGFSKTKRKRRRKSKNEGQAT